MAKLGANAADGFIRKPDPAIRLVLLYGEDAGLARERMILLGKNVVEDLGDPFNVAEISTARLSETPSLLAEEAAAISMMGGQRVVLIRDAANGLAPTVSGFLEQPVGDALIILVAGSLPPSSKLRQTVEKSKLGMAIPCYLDGPQAILGLIDRVLGADNIRIDPDARTYLADHLGQDRGSSRGEIEKLALFAGRDGQLNLEDVRTAIGDSAAPAIDDAVQAAFGGNPGNLDRAISQLFALGTSAIPIIRAAANHCLRLRQVQAAISNGSDMKSAMKSLRPPVFFKVEAAFSEQVRRWSGKNLADALDLLLEAEGDCKRTGAVDSLICNRTFHRIAVIAIRSKAASRR